MTKLNLTLQEACDICKEYGWVIDKVVLGKGIADGRYSFGTVIGEGATGRKTYEIFRGDLIRWLQDKMGG